MNAFETPASQLRDPIEYFIEGWRLFTDYFAKVFGVLSPLLLVTLTARIYEAPSDRFLYAEMGMTILLQSLLLVALIGMLPRMVDGEPVSARRALQWGFQFWGVYVVNWVKVAVLIFAGLFLFIVPGVYLAISFSIFGYVVVLEQHPAPLQRCLRLVYGNRLKMLFILSLFVMYTVFEAFVGIILRQAGAAWLLTPFAIVDVIMLGYMTTVFYLVYLDLSADDFEEVQSAEKLGHTGAVFPMEDDSAELDDADDIENQETDQDSDKE